MRVEKFDARAYSSTTTTDSNACTISSSSSSCVDLSSALLYATVIDKTKRGRQSHYGPYYNDILKRAFVVWRILFFSPLSLFSRVIILKKGTRIKIEEEEEKRTKKKKKRRLFSNFRSNDKKKRRRIFRRVIIELRVSSGKEEEEDTVRLLLPR